MQLCCRQIRLEAASNKHTTPAHMQTVLPPQNMNIYDFFSIPVINPANTKHLQFQTFAEMISVFHKFID